MRDKENGKDPNVETQEKGFQLFSISRFQLFVSSFRCEPFRGKGACLVEDDGNRRAAGDKFRVSALQEVAIALFRLLQ